MQRMAAAGRQAAWWAGMASLLIGAKAAAQVITATPAARTPLTATSHVAGYASLPASGSILASAEANLIRGWYRDYLGRDPGQELPALVQLLRGGMSPLDLQATILSSEEFYWQKGRDPQAFVRETLQAVTWSDPSPAEVQRWTDRLTKLRGDRFALVREILLAQRRPTSTPSGELADAARRLANAARLAADTIEFEIGGTPQGHRARMQVQALISALAPLQEAAASDPAGQQVQQALQAAQRAYTALSETLSQPAGTAPAAAGIVRRIGTMLVEAQATVGTPATPPAPPPPAVDQLGYVPQIVLDHVGSARRATESLIQVLTSQAYQDYTYHVALRELDALAFRLAGLEPLVRSGVSHSRLQWEVQGLADSMPRIQTQFSSGRLPYAARLYWQSLESSLARLREAVGLTSSASTSVLRPSPFHESLLPLLDQAAAQIDVFLAGTTPLVYTIPDVPKVQTDARSLKNRVLTLRQQAASAEAPAVLYATLQGMIGDYRGAFDRWNQIVASYRLVHPARLAPVGETLNRVEQLILEALRTSSSSSNTSSASPLAVELNLLGGEVADARLTLGNLAGFRQQQAIDLYLEQLGGYVTQIQDALQRGAQVDARRLAVGMQGVVGRMQSELETLRQRLAGASAADQQRLAELAWRASRIGQIVDRVEAQLY